MINHINDHIRTNPDELAVFGALALIPDQTIGSKYRTIASIARETNLTYNQVCGIIVKYYGTKIEISDAYSITGDRLVSLIEQ